MVRILDFPLREYNTANVNIQTIGLVVFDQAKLYIMYMGETGELPKGVLPNKAVESQPIFTDGQIKKWDNDINTILSLQSDPRFPGTPVVSGGYAVDILFGGKMRRSHGDIDFVVYTSGKNSKELNPSHSIPVILAKDSSWLVVPEKDPGKLELKAAGSEGGQRRLEFDFTDRDPDDTRVVRRSIMDSAGFTHSVLVEDLNYLVAKKIGIISKRLSMSPAEAQGHTRPLLQQDIDELNLLITHADFNQNVVLSRLVKSIVRKQGLTEQDAILLAQQQLQTAMNTRVQ